MSFACKRLNKNILTQFFSVMDGFNVRGINRYSKKKKKKKKKKILLQLQTACMVVINILNWLLIFEKIILNI